jgi:hypothetical protein
MITLYLHIEGLETTVVDVEKMPEATDTLILCKNPRRRDGKNAPYVVEDVTTILIPVNRIVYIEVLTAEEEEAIETFIRQ